MAGDTQAPSCVWEDSACCGAAKPVHHNHGSLHAREPVLHNNRRRLNEMPEHRN